MNKNNKNKNLYKCSDLALASVLTLWLPLIDLDNSNLHKVFFCFEDSDNLRMKIKEYWDGTLRVEPKSYFQNIKLLKSRMYQE